MRFGKAFEISKHVKELKDSGLSIQEIAEQMNTSESQIKVRLKKYNQDIRFQQKLKTLDDDIFQLDLIHRDLWTIIRSLRIDKISELYDWYISNTDDWIKIPNTVYFRMEAALDQHSKEHNLSYSITQNVKPTRNVLCFSLDQLLLRYNIAIDIASRDYTATEVANKYNIRVENISSLLADWRYIRNISRTISNGDISNLEISAYVYNCIRNLKTISDVCKTSISELKTKYSLTDVSLKELQSAIVKYEDRDPSVAKSPIYNYVKLSKVKMYEERHADNFDLRYWSFSSTNGIARFKVYKNIFLEMIFQSTENIPNSVVSLYKFELHEETKSFKYENRSLIKADISFDEALKLSEEYRKIILNEEVDKVCQLGNQQNT